MKKEHFIGPILFLLVWQIAALWVHPLLIPSPAKVSKNLYFMFKSGNIFPDLASTLLRFLIGFLLAGFLGISLGLILGYAERLYRAFEFLIDFLRSIPVITLFPLFMLLFGLGDRAKVAIVAFSCGLILLISTMDGVRNANRTRLMTAKLFKASWLKTFRRVIFPEALPEIVTGVRLALSIGLVVVVATEMFVGTKHGLGRRIYDASFVMYIAEMDAVILLAGFVGYGINKLFSLIARNVHWAGR